MNEQDPNYDYATLNAIGYCQSYVFSHSEFRNVFELSIASPIGRIELIDYLRDIPFQRIAVNAPVKLSIQIPLHTKEYMEEQERMAKIAELKNKIKKLCPVLDELDALRSQLKELEGK